MVVTSQHPDPDQLVAFGMGRLDPAAASTIESHLEECPACCETLLDLKDDTFVGLLRSAAHAQGGVPAEVQRESYRTDGPGESADALDATRVLPDRADATTGNLPPQLAEHPRYHIVDLIGRGGMGDVYRAEHRLMNRTVALKVINRELTRNPQAVQRFHREVQSAARLTHPNIVTAYDAEQAGDAHYLVMEYVDGTDLAGLVKAQGPLTVSQACEFIRQAAMGLQHAHEQGMVHRDIKPHNLMVTPGGRLKILDFGLATLARDTGCETRDARRWQGQQRSNGPANDGPGLPDGQTRPPDDHADRGLTRAGTVMGTPDFMSPEQAGDARSVDIRSDIYSLGCTLYYLLTGRPPFDEGSAADRVAAHLDREPAPIQNLRADVPDELAEVLRRTLAKDPTERFQSPAEIAEALAPFVDRHRPPGDTGPSDDAEQGWSGRDRLAIACAILTACCLALAVLGMGLLDVSMLWVVGLFIGIGATAWTTPPGSNGSLTTRGWLSWAATLGMAGIIVVTTDRGSLEIKTADDSVQVIVSKVTSEDFNVVELEFVDTLSGSSVRLLPSGVYTISLQGDQNRFELDKHRFVLKRDGKVVVRVTRKTDNARTLPRPQISESVPSDSSLTSPGEWTNLFNGRNLDGWSSELPLWSVEDGQLVGRCDQPDRPFSDFLIHEGNFTDFELQLQYKLVRGNSGLQFRSRRDDRRRLAGYQVEISPGMTGDVYVEPALGYIASVAGTPRTAINQSIYNREWNDITLRCRKDHIRIEVNGNVAVDRHDQELPESGFVALQMHWSRAEGETAGQPLEVRFRNIRIRKLTTESASKATTTTRQSIAELITATQAAKSDEEWIAALKQHGALFEGAELDGKEPEAFGRAELEKMQSADRSLIRLLVELPEAAREQLFADGYLKWKFNELDTARQTAMQQALSDMMAASSKMGFPNDLPEYVPGMLTSGDVGFAILNVTETGDQLVVWYLLMPQAPLPLMLPLIGNNGADDDGQAFSKSIYRQLGELEDRPFSKLPELARHPVIGPPPPPLPKRNMGGTSLFGITDTGRRIVYIVDGSGSMSDFGAFRVAKAELMSSLERLDATQEFQVIIYSNSPLLLEPSDARSDMFRGIDTHRLKVRQQIEAIQPDGGTDHLPALNEALKLTPDVIFFLTDSAEPELTDTELARITQRNDGGSRIHCIEFGNGTSLHAPRGAKNFLQKLAQQNNGRYAYRMATNSHDAEAPDAHQ